ncbi:MAG: hypothetical protein WCW66_02020 [Patescibacteria group bacterium]
MPGYSKPKIFKMKYLYIFFVAVIIIVIGGGLFIVVNQKNDAQVLSSTVTEINNVQASSNVVSYISDQDGNQEIYLEDKDQQKIQRVTDTNVSEFSPTLSSDGKKLAFFSEEDSFFGIWIYSLENNEKKLVSITKANPKRLMFSPDSLLLAYTEEDGIQNQLYVINTKNSSKERVSSFCNDFTWSADSSAIVYTRNSQTGITKTEMDIRMIAENGKFNEPSTVFVGGVAPVFFNDSERLFFIDTNGEYLSLVSTSLRGEDYQEEFQIKIQPQDNTSYRLLNNPIKNELLLSILSEDKLVESLYISLEDEVVLPLDENVDSAHWKNDGEIIYIAVDQNEQRQIWTKDSYDAISLQITNKNNNWF